MAPFAFAVDETQPTIVSKWGLDHLMGQREGLSFIDTRTVNEMYGHFNKPPDALIAALEDSYPEGTTVNFDGSGSSDPDDETLWYEWNLGDDICQPSNPAPKCSAANPAHEYRDNGEYAVSLRVDDAPLDRRAAAWFYSDEAHATVSVFNVAPAVNAGLDVTVDEGSLYRAGGSFLDPARIRDAPYTGTVDYGDGSGVKAPFINLQDNVEIGFILEHTYADNRPGNAPYTVAVTITDKDGGVGADELEVTVLNVAPIVDAGPDATVTSGEVFAFSGSFSDPGLVDAPWNWTLDWGNGDTSTGATGNPSASIAQTLQVCVAGEYTVSLSVTDKDGGTGSDLLVLTVPYRVVDLLIMPGGAPNPLNLRRGGLASVAVLSTPTFDATAIDLATVRLGDGLGEGTPVARQRSRTRTATASWTSS